MIPNNLHYLALMAPFTLAPVILIWWLRFPLMIKNIKVILMVSVVGLVYQLVGDPFAEGWGAWSFGEGKNIGVWVLNFPIENSIYAILVSLAVSSATISFADYHERGRLNAVLKKFFRNR